MSAYMVDKEHIDVMISVALRGPGGLAVSPDNAWYPLGWFIPGQYGEEDQRTQLDFTNADEVGTMLVATNLASIHARYPDRTSLATSRSPEQGRYQSWLNPTSVASS